MDNQEPNTELIYLDIVSGETISKFFGHGTDGRKRLEEAKARLKALSDSYVTIDVRNGKLVVEQG